MSVSRTRGPGGAPGRGRAKGKARAKPAARGRHSSKRGNKGGNGAGKRDVGTGNNGPRRSVGFRLAYWGIICTLWGGLAAGALTLFIMASVPDPLVASLDTRPPNLTILAADGTVMAERGLRRGHVRLKQLPPHLINAVLATEDRRFYSHFGVDPLGLARAAFENLRAGTVVEGGSTITQQLAKNLFLSPDRTIWRKLREAVLAVWLEARFSKDKILELYLNRAYFGAGCYGVEAAARRYFGKSARDVDVGEAALLAGLLKAPSRYAPTTSMDRADARASQVLANMVDAGLLSSSQAVSAMAEPAHVENPSGISGYEYATDWVAELLPSFIGERDEDLIVQTTIDANLQRAAQDIVESAMSGQGDRRDAGEAAAVLLDTKGAVKAIVGGRSYAKSQFNRAIKALRQPGSAFKPFVFLAALESGMTPDTITYDAPIKVKGWSPKNYHDDYRGRVTLREALADSINTAAVRLTMEVGRWKVIRTARRLGISSVLHDHPSIALGTSEVTLLDITGAYVPFANGGYGVLPHVISRVRTDKGKVIYRRRGSGIGQVVALPYVGAMNEMLNATLIEGTGRRAALPDRPAAGKTGTTQSFRDAWFVGYTGTYVAGVWVGNDDSSPMKKVTGGSLPAEIWRQIMTDAHRGQRVVALPGTTSPPLVAEQAPPSPQPRPAAVAAPSEQPFVRRVLDVLSPRG